MDLRDFVIVLLELTDKLVGIEETVGSTSLDDLALLFNSEVLPLEGRANVLFEESKDFVMGNGARIGLEETV
jgi:hypothetical protein